MSAESPNNVKSGKSPTSDTDNESAGACSVTHRPEMFKLNIDCLHAIFDWLSLSELIPVAKTCKRLQRAAGDYFRSHYVSAEITSKDGHIYTPFRDIDIFVEFIPRISTTCHNLRLNHLIGDDCRSLKHIRLSGGLLEDRIEYIQEVLQRVQTIDLVECPNREEIYDLFLKYCTNVTSLSVKRSYKMRNNAIVIGSSNEWLLRKYPTLQHFELTDIYEPERNELIEFFQQNPNVRTFATDSNSLWENRQSLVTSGIQLNKLAIEFMNAELADEIIKLLAELYAVGFFKRLHVYSSRIPQEYLDKIFSSSFSNSLEMLRGRIQRINVSLLNVTVLSFPGTYWNETFETTELYRFFPNLERIFFEEASTDHILPFICASPKVNTIKIKGFRGGSHYVRGFFDLDTFNNEREKLAEAKKITLYVNEHFVMLTKWANRPVNYPLIELRQFAAFEWNELNSDYRNNHMSYY